MRSKLIISDLEKVVLEQIVRNHSKPYYRTRAQAILLRSEGFNVKTLALMYKTRGHTIYEWIRRFKLEGFLGLRIIEGRGVKSKMDDLTISQIDVIQAEITQNPQSLREVSAILSEKFGFTLTISMLKKYLKKKLKYTWHRLRKWLKPKQDPLEYARLAAELETLLQLEDDGYIKVYFADESGFCLDPTVPYGWQPCGKYTAIVPQKSQRRNVFGLFTRDNEFEGYDTTGTMNADMLVAFIDDFAQNNKQKSVIVLDNAPFHHANIVKNKIEQWAKKDIFIWFLPPYSPHLNKIETLWRKIKYEWLKPQDYLNWNALNNALDNIFTNIGTNFKIQF